jgi:hypothetical protein
MRAVYGPTRGRALTYQGFIKALHRLGLNLGRAAAEQMRQQLLNEAPARCRRFGYFVRAADGSRFALPRTEAHTACSPR